MTGGAQPHHPACPWPVMVLTAGLGTRLRPLSRLRAKPAMPVAGVPLSGRILRWLASEGVRSAVLNLHHLPATITAAIGDGQAFGVAVRYSWERDILGSAGGPARALPLLEADRFFLINGDTLTTPNLTALSAQHVASGALATMALVVNPDPMRYGSVTVDAGGFVMGFTRPGSGRGGWHFIGVQAVESRIFAPLDPDAPAETVGQVYRALIAASPGSVRAFTCTAPFRDIGTPADYWSTCLAVARDEGLGDVVAGPESVVDPQARVARTVLWDDVHVSRAACLDSCIVASGVTIPDGAHYTRSVIVPRTGLEPGANNEVAGGLLISPLEPR